MEIEIHRWPQVVSGYRSIAGIHDDLTLRVQVLQRARREARVKMDGTALVLYTVIRKPKGGTHHGPTDK